MRAAFRGKVALGILGISFCYYSAWLLLSVSAYVLADNTPPCCLACNTLLTCVSHVLCGSSRCPCSQPLLEQRLPLFPSIEWGVLVPIVPFILLCSVLLGYVGLLLLTQPFAGASV